MPDETPELLVTSKETKPGYQTSEFWQSILASVAGIGVVIFGVVNNNVEVLWAGVTLAGLSTAGYSVGRGIAKQG